MKAAYVAIHAVSYAVICSSLLALPLSLALAERYGHRPCPSGAPCLPRELTLSPTQQKAVEAIYMRNRHEQLALQQETRRELLRLLTPEQLRQLRRHNPALRDNAPGASSPGEG